MELLINKIPSSCRNRSCSFNFTANLTPTVHTVSPAQGQGGITLTIQGSGFGESVSVSIGSSKCEVLTSNATTIECDASRHAAGTYEVLVSVEGIGQARNENGTCFTYLLSLDSITPSMGGATGSYQVNISGEGFLDFSVDDHTRERLVAPWFQNGLGFPDMTDPLYFSLCPNVKQQFENELKFLASCFLEFGERAEENKGGPAGTAGNDTACFPCFEDCETMEFRPERIFEVLPLHVFIGSSPCIVTEAAIDHVFCTTIISPPGLKDVTVSVLDQQQILVSAFEVVVELTPIIGSVSPSFGPVSGSTVLTLTGNRLTTASDSNVSVTIGQSECEVDFANATTIVCTTNPHGPVFAPIIVFTASGGVAGLESALGSLEVHPFPVFEYRLSAALPDGVSSGSLTGGTEVLVLGSVFVEGETDVYFGDKHAEILFVWDEGMLVLSPTSATTTDIYLSRINLRGKTGSFHAVYMQRIYFLDTVTLHVDRYLKYEVSEKGNL